MYNVARRFCLLLLAGFLACDGSVDPVSVEPAYQDTKALTPTLAKTSHCYAVQFNVSALQNFWEMHLGVFQGTVSGDLEGSVEVEFDWMQTKTAGVTKTRPGTASWFIQGGIIPGSITFVTEFENLTILNDRPGSPPALCEHKGTHRILEGVEKANLTHKGTSLVTGHYHDTVREYDWNFHGVICLE